MSENKEHPSFMELTEIRFPIFKATFIPGVHIDYAKVETAYERYKDSGKGELVSVVVDITGIRLIDVKSRRAMVEDRFEERIKCVAVVVRDPISRMLGNFIMGLNRPTVPTKLFNNEADAIAWAEKLNGMEPASLMQEVHGN